MTDCRGVLGGRDNLHLAHLTFNKRRIKVINKSLKTPAGYTRAYPKEREPEACTRLMNSPEGFGAPWRPGESRAGGIQGRGQSLQLRAAPGRPQAAGAVQVSSPVSSSEGLPPRGAPSRAAGKRDRRKPARSLQDG